METKITTRHQWIDKLEKLIPEIVPLQLGRKKDTAYVVERNGSRSYPDADAYNFSNSADHDVLIQRAVRNLLNRTDRNSVGHLLDELTARKTYGAINIIADEGATSDQRRPKEIRSYKLILFSAARRSSHCAWTSQSLALCRSTCAVLGHLSCS